MNVHQVEAQVLDPGGDYSLSGGGSDLGAAKNSLEGLDFHLTKRTALGNMDLMLPKVVCLEGAFTHLHER